MWRKGGGLAWLSVDDMDRCVCNAPHVLKVQRQLEWRQSMDWLDPNACDVIFCVSIGRFDVVSLHGLHSQFVEVGQKGRRRLERAGHMMLQKWTGPCCLAAMVSKQLYWYLKLFQFPEFMESKTVPSLSDILSQSYR